MSWLVIAKVTLVFVLAWLALLLMRRQSAALRHVVVLIALLAGILLPASERVLPSWQVLPGPERSAPRYVIDSPLEQSTTSSPSRTDAAAPAARIPARMNIEELLWIAWVLGAVLQLSLLLVRILAMHVAANRAEPFVDKAWLDLLNDLRRRFAIRTVVELRLRDAGKMPAVWGTRQPVVLLPADSVDWTDARRRDVLAHELAHVARHDLLFLVLAQIVCALHWFNPLAWILKRRLALESEHACDDMALASGTSAPLYADHLLKTAIRYTNRNTLAPVMAARSLLEGRIMAILDKDRSRGSASPLAVTAIGIAAVLLLAPIASLTWADVDDRWRGTTVHAHAHVHSDSAQFAAHLADLGIETDDVDALLANLDAPEPVTRAAAAWALGDADDPRVVDPLIRAGYDSVALVRQWAVRSLAPWVEPRVASMLIDRLQDPDAEVRQWAVRSLDRHDPDVTTAPLIESLADSNVEVREWTVRVLAKADTASVQSAIANRAVVETDNDVREWIVRSLDSSQSTQNIEVLINALYSESADVRQWAVRGLSATRDDRAVDALIGMLQDDNAEVREWSVRALGVCGNDRATASLQTMTSDPNSDVREWVDRALRKIDC